MIWAKCPKEIFVNKRRVKRAVTEAVCEYNKGTVRTIVETQKALGVATGGSTKQLATILDCKNLENVVKMPNDHAENISLPPHVVVPCGSTQPHRTYTLSLEPSYLLDDSACIARQRCLQHHRQSVQRSTTTASQKKNKHEPSLNSRSICIAVAANHKSLNLQKDRFERGRIVGLREAGLSYRAVAARVQRNSSTIMRVPKQWTDEGRTARKSGNGPRNVTSARDDRRLSIRRRLLQRGLRARIPLDRIPLTQNHRRLRLQWANVHRSWRADWQQVVFSDESRLNLWHHDGRIRVRCYAGERHIPECIIERHSGRTPGVMPQAIPFLQGLPGAVFQQDNARPHVTKTVKSYLDSQQVQFLPWTAYSADMPPIEHVWDIVGRRLVRDLRPVASTDELWLRIQTIWNTLPQADIQNLFNSMPRRVAALITARGAHTKY
ncbi:transposable element Tc1 transposase [Trichonephila clavipes]|nr:transposable element Tc1 transposase [Trichonephila clavipes]